MHFKSRGETRLLGNPSRIRYEHRAIWLQRFEKKVASFWSSTARLCLTPPRKEYFVAWQRKAVTLRRSKNTDPSWDQAIARPAKDTGDRFCTATPITAAPPRFRLRAAAAGPARRRRGRQSRARKTQQNRS